MKKTFRKFKLKKGKLLAATLLSLSCGFIPGLHSDVNPVAELLLPAHAEAFETEDGRSVIVKSGEKHEELSSEHKKESKKELKNNPAWQLPDMVIYANPVDATVLASKMNIGAAKMVPKLLQYMAGIQIQERPNAGGTEDLTVKLRGHDARRFTVLVDGVPYNMSGVMGGGYVNWDAIPLGMVERVEVTKGAKATSYGQTEGGIINVITRRSDGKGGEIQAEGGTHGREQYSFNYGVQEDGSGIMVYGSKEGKDAYLRNGNFANEQLGLAARYSFDGVNNITLRFDHSKTKKCPIVRNIPGTPGYDPSYPVTDSNDIFYNMYLNPIALPDRPGDGSQVTTYHNNMALTWNFEKPWGDSSLSYWKNYEKHNEIMYSADGKRLLFNRTNVTDTSDGFLYNGTCNVSVKHKLGYGIDYRRLRYGDGWYNYNATVNAKPTNHGYILLPEGASGEEITVGRELYPSQKVDTLGIYVEDSWKLTDKLTANLGLRFDQTKGSPDDARAVEKGIKSFTKSGFSPKFTVKHLADPDTTFKLSVNRIWRAPSSAEYFWNEIYNKKHNNGELNPEKGMEYEISAEHLVNDRYSFKTTAYYQDIDNYINFIHVPPFKIETIDNAKLWGFELENDFKINKHSFAFLNYTNQHTEKHGATNKSLLNRELDYHPEHRLAFGYGYDKGIFHARYTAIYNGKQSAVKPFPNPKTGQKEVAHLGGYITHNIGVTTLIPDIGKLNFTIYNLFDKKYCAIYGYPMEGRVFTMSLTRNFR